jgi:two-component system chemotaxis response regulator CheY
VRALVVDDSSLIRTVLLRMLSDLGYEVLQATGGREALAVLDRHPLPDVVLIDWNMPEMTGLELIGALRSAERFRDVPLMMVTTETEVGQVARALAAGADEYLMKPFTSEMVQDKLSILGLGHGG